ncbi:MAG TPA: 4-alpha-glucanotransferase [Candidatus Onthomonas avicola]|nr:4-alpha-glucanotransferase [Candidatus Onthomonas avicola]
MFSRSSGILMHISSLPGPYGIGSMGKEARHFVDFLQRGGQSYWQLLPLVWPGEWNSPYMSPSSAAGNPMFIDLEALAEAGLLTWDEVNAQRYNGSPDRAAFDFLHVTRLPLLRQAFQRADEALLERVRAFAREHSDWLPDFALFMALNDYFGCGLQDWPDKKLLRRDEKTVAKYAQQLAQDVLFYQFLQYLFFQQWSALKAYANEKGVSIIGDVPIYVSGNSADVWVHPELFRVTAARRPKYVAGVPADLFNDQGQFWGFPLYNWKYHQETGFAWWCNRIRQSMAFYDVIRIDHFRGFYDYWEIPATAESALEGKWRKGPGMKIIEAFRKNLPDAVFIAEDLGDLSEGAVRFIQEAGLPGMRVLTDAFSALDGTSGFLPHQGTPDSVMYTGTHDTPTFVQWYNDMATPEQRNYCTNYLHIHMDEGVGWCAIAGAWISPCRLAMAPLQDVLCLGADARMNFPGTTDGANWSWRVRAEALNDTIADRLHYVTFLYGRLPAKRETGEEKKQ